MTTDNKKAGELRCDHIIERQSDRRYGENCGRLLAKDGVIKCPKCGGMTPFGPPETLEQITETD